MGAFGHSAPTTSAQQDGEAPLRELAEQLLAQPYASYPGAPTQEQRVELLVGQQPSGLPLALPVPPMAGSSAAWSDGPMAR